jgi:hypothetical protein
MYVYILQSEKTGNYYCGQTQDHFLSTFLQISEIISNNLV